MSRTVYVNGQYLPEAEASLSIFDRAVLFADAVYEVAAVIDGALVDYPAHQQRLARSLKELGIPLPVDPDALLDIHHELLRKNALTEGLIYLQVSRGCADRNFLMPHKATPSLVLFTQAMPLLDTVAATNGLRVISRPDMRWGRRDIKTTQLLFASMMKTEAVAAGVDDVWLHEQGMVTEASSSNAHIINDAGVLVTRPLSNEILHGITRAAVLDYAAESGMQVEQRTFSLEEAKTAREAFITSATAFVTPVVEIDGVAIGTGRPGPATQRLRELYILRSRSTHGGL
ncbi:D-amino-acid transaminase [Spiribacter sp. C176]|uniref:Aminodeoxychorismate lyase n=1 Tax=Spiribacter salilacus TaxID=2664894 RepID=A0A6N7QS22_9GAMM|nr:D-amino-acid transaminase [Spiribacter salilacus]